MASIISSCMSWVPTFWEKLPVPELLEEILKGRRRHLPDEVIIQILAKLPAKSVLRCRCVCRRWKALITTKSFVELQRKHRVPMIIVFRQGGGDGEKALCLVHTSEAKERITEIQHTISVNSVKPVSKSNRQEFLYSSNGLIIFREEFRESTSGLEHYVLLNPITREKVRLITPRGLIYGIYSSPFGKDQCCLLWGGRLLRENGSMSFRILVLDGSKSQPQPQMCCWRELYDDDDAPFSYQPRAQTAPIIKDDVLYWMVGNKYAISRQHSSSTSNIRLAPSCAESIMALDTKKEKFSVIPHPGPRDQYCKDDPEHNRMHLVEMDDQDFLCLCESSLFDESINIWILRQGDDMNGPLWMRWHRVSIDLDVSNFPSGRSRLNFNGRPVVIVDGELLLEWPSRGLFALNLKMDTAVTRLEYGSSMYVHTPSFVSLSNCEPEILMAS